MQWIELVTLAALLQFFAFGLLVGRARMRHQIQAPAQSGHPIFERYFRVQMNTLETLVVFLPSLWIAAQYWRQEWVALIGVVYLVGRQLYLRGYVSDPKRRSLGYGLSALPILVLIIASLIGIVRALIAAAAVTTG